MKSFLSVSLLQIYLCYFNHWFFTMPIWDLSCDSITFSHSFFLRGKLISSFSSHIHTPSERRWLEQLFSILMFISFIHLNRDEHSCCIFMEIDDVLGQSSYNNCYIAQKHNYSYLSSLLPDFIRRMQFSSLWLKNSPSLIIIHTSGDITPS